MKVHWRADKLGETDPVYVPLQETLAGLLLVQNAGLEDNEQVEALVEEYVRVKDPPDDETALVLMVSEAVGEGGDEGVGLGVGATGVPAMRTTPSPFQ